MLHALLDERAPIAKLHTLVTHEEHHRVRGKVDLRRERRAELVHGPLPTHVLVVGGSLEVNADLDVGARRVVGRG